MKPALLAVSLLIGACSPVVTAPSVPAEPPETITTTTIAAPRPSSPVLAAPAAPTSTVAEPAPTVATAQGELAVYSHPSAPVPKEELPATTILGTPTVVRVMSQAADGWLQVSLPGRPNGRTGWIKSEEVVLSIATTSIVIDLGDRQMEVWRDGVLTVSTSVAIGSATSPTPTGVFFVTDAIDMTASPGPWGPFAFGLSARSDVITEFNGGDGIIGIHGTNRPSSIGEARSLGCVRVPNEIILEMADYVELGALVEIRA